MMREDGRRSSLFLIELVLNLVIFTLCAAVCIGLLMRAHAISQDSTAVTQAVYLAQTRAESLRAGLPDDTPLPPGYTLIVTQAAADGLVSAVIDVKFLNKTVFQLNTAWPQEVDTP